MSVTAIKQTLKDNIDKLSASEAKLANKELPAYFDYLQSSKEMPKGLKLSFAQFLELENSLKEDAKGKKVPTTTVFKSLRKKYS